MLLPLRRHWRAVGRPPRARLHRDAAAGGRVGTQQHALLAGSARRPCQPQWRTDALADRERAIAARRARSTRPGNAGVGRRAVPGTGVADRSMEPRA
jgi:hypothetical protein